MGLQAWNQTLRTDQYPPPSISQALHFSLSPKISQAYHDAETYIQQSLCHSNKNNNNAIFLPHWAMTWPGGQLTGVGRNASFSSNIERYERIFSSIFLSCTIKNMIPSHSKLKFVNVISLENLTTHQSLCGILSKIMTQVMQRTSRQELQPTKTNCNSFNISQLYIAKTFQNDHHKDTKQNNGCNNNNNNCTHRKDNKILQRNAGAKLSNAQIQPNDKDIQLLADTFYSEIERLAKLCQCRFEWNTITSIKPHHTNMK